MDCKHKWLLGFAVAVGLILVLVLFCLLGSDDETSVSRLVVTGVTVPQYGVEGKHAVLYCRLHR